MRTVAIDPGTANAGVAVFEDGVLVLATHLRYPRAEDFRAFKANVWVREKMQERANFAIAGADLRAIEALMRATRLKFKTYTPSQWKGNLPKETHHKRIRQVLSAEEAVIFDATNGDGRDAIGIGLFFLGRTGRGGVTRKQGPGKV